MASLLWASLQYLACFSRSPRFHNSTQNKYFLRVSYPSWTLTIAIRLTFPESRGKSKNFLCRSSADYFPQWTSNEWLRNSVLPQLCPSCIVIIKSINFHLYRTSDRSKDMSSKQSVLIMVFNSCPWRNVINYQIKRLGIISFSSHSKIIFEYSLYARHCCSCWKYSRKQNKIRAFTELTF